MSTSESSDDTNQHKPLPKKRRSKRLATKKTKTKYPDGKIGFENTIFDSTDKDQNKPIRKKTKKQQKTKNKPKKANTMSNHFLILYMKSYPNIKQALI